MSHLTYFSYPGFGERVRDIHHMSQAVRVGDKIEISGQGGWLPSIAAQDGFHPTDSTSWPSTSASHIDQTFENVDVALKHAGGTGWNQVYKLRIFYLDPACIGDVVRSLKVWCPDHRPIITAVQVKGLAFPAMEVEIEVSAHVAG